MAVISITKKNKAAALAAALGIALALLGDPVSAHDIGPISDHSLSDDIYYGYGPVWGTSFSAWNQARTNATNACLAAGNEDCTFSVAAWDHSTFWGEGEFVHEGERGQSGFTPKYIAISHPLVTDTDGDGVDDGDDLCSDTPLGAAIDGNGCSGAQNIAVAAPCDGDWKNHGAYVSTVSHAANAQVAAGLLTEEGAAALVSEAARSDCGHKEGRGRGRAGKLVPGADATSWGEIKRSKQ